MSLTNYHSHPLTVHLAGTIDHPDFDEVAALLRATAVCEDVPAAAPEVVVVAQARPGQISRREVELIQHRWPLAGVVSIAGSWCEGEMRTGRPWPGIKRFYWYEFPAWWRQQLTLRNAGLCPDWLRPTTDTPRVSTNRNRKFGVILLSVTHRDTAHVLADVLHDAGYATVWGPPGRPTTVARGTVVGIWDGGQMDDREAKDLAAFCHSLARDAAPVIALLDFPRRDRYEIAQQVGASAVLGKPWINTDLIATIAAIATHDASPQSIPHNRAA